MEKQKRWHFVLICVVILLTVYNILPTVFYYSKPLHQPVGQIESTKIAESIARRIDHLEEDAVAWLKSYTRHIGLKTSSITLNPHSPSLITVSFINNEQADTFRRHLPRAGTLIPFIPAQLTLYEASSSSSKDVIVRRNIPVHFDPDNTDQYFQFTPKISQGKIADTYRNVISDRLLSLGVTLGGPSENAQSVIAFLKAPGDPASQEILFYLSQKILSHVQVFGESSPAARRFFASFSQTPENQPHLIQQFLSAIDQTRDTIKLEKIHLEQESERLKKENQYLESAGLQRLELLQSRENTLLTVASIVKRHQADFSAGLTPWNFQSLKEALATGMASLSSSNLLVIPLAERHPLIAQIAVDWHAEKIFLKPYDDLIEFKNHLTARQKDLYDSLIYDEISKVGRISGEEITPYREEFEISFNELLGSKSFLILDLKQIAKAEIEQLLSVIRDTWSPRHPDLLSQNFPILDYQTWLNLPKNQQKLGLVLFAPVLFEQTPPQGFRNNSIYIIAKGIDQILQTLEGHEQTEEAQQFIRDFNQLQELLKKFGFVGYTGSFANLKSEFSHDFIFEGEDYYQMILNASRENFSVRGTKRYAVLPFIDLEQRILSVNKIETQMHEDLLKWRDEYQSANIDSKSAQKYDVPPPTKNILWSNFCLSFAKYFRGDERRVLHWGLDLSGGKTVEIELRDTNNRPVTDENDINQGIEELYNRVNKMGVSEVQLRREGKHISIDFPGSQIFSAAELIKASSMSFHIINEKFTPGNLPVADAVDRFLQDVWNEAVITNKKDIDSIQLIAIRHLYGDNSDTGSAQPRSESAKKLYDNGLRLAPHRDFSNSTFNDSLSKIALFRGKDFRDWQGQTHPLLIVFRNYTLEGSSLEDIHGSYDPAKGNYLSFSVKSSQITRDGQKINPRADLYSWSSIFSKEKIAGTPNAAITHGRGWRMAVILNGSVISTPALDSPLRDHAMITGSFSQREINQLEADLKAGSLSFVPHILSEKNVSPDLGEHERRQGVTATVVALILVIAAMIAYYRFGGVIASIAVLFNLLIIWAALQNLQANLTLAGIAGIILALAVAVDANVLVFERIREEFAISGRIAQAIHAGYRKAFSAIIDSNVTTIIAALILLHFDAGPIKGLAVCLIIGIISSMFTALFLTRYFFMGWVKNPKNKALKMANFIHATKFNFLKYTKPTVLLSCFVILLGGALLFTQRHTILGMDFTGGYAITLDIKPDEKGGYRQDVEQALIAKGISSKDFQIRELEPENHLRLFLSRSLEERGHPFFKMPLENGLRETDYSYQSNPRIVWIIQALESHDLKFTPMALEQIDKSWASISGQMSDSMRNSAIIGLCVALLCILVYITARFEFKYAASATICLAHDVLFTLGFIAILHALHVDIQIDLSVIAALMTIVGYSLNDTIIIFDRIREDVRLMRKSNFREIINHALNVTLSRTLMTSGITLLVLLALLFLGGHSIFGFALVMTIGVVFGTLSSLFIAAPLMHYFHEKELKKLEKLEDVRE